MEKACADLGIGFQGIYFRAAKRVPEPEWDEKMEEKRFRILETQKKWVVGNL